MKKIKIMLVDDHQLVLDGLKSIIASVQDFEVMATASNGTSALQSAARILPDVVLMDIDMPVLNGIDTTKRLLRDHPAMKVLALTMHNEKGMIHKMLEAGASGYILKNANKEDLVTAIRKVYAGQNYFCSEVTLTLLEKKSTHIIASQNANDGANYLTSREIEIMKLIAQGFSNRQIGEKLFISFRTVDTHRTNIMDKLKVKNIAGLIRYAVKNGFAE